MTQDKVMLLIDADNVSLDVIEQAVAWVGKHFGGPHVRRAYCTAESAVKHQTAFKRLSIRPMVNLAAGKNSTDIALAVDAIDLTLAERPDVVVIASSDSDFAPLVSRLREKGCRVIGIGQQGKTGDETRAVYDDYEVMEHHRAKSQGRSEGRGDGRASERGSGWGDGRGEGRGDGRGTGRDRGRGRSGRKAVEPVPAPLELKEVIPVVAAEAQQAQQAQQVLPELAVAPPSAPVETRPARAPSRGGRRKPVAEAVAGPVTEAPNAAPKPLADVPATLPVQAALAPAVADGPTGLSGAEAKPARKPRRRRPAAAKRPAEAGSGSLP